MDTCTVSFFGHRQLDSPLQIEKRLEQLVIELLAAQSYVEFLVGRDGEFDLLAASVIHRCQRTFRADNSALVWVMPYLTAEYRDNEEAFREYYNGIEICEKAAGKHFKAAFQIRNRSMIDRSDLAVFCIQHTNGGAWQMLRYAKRRGIPILFVNPVESEIQSV